MREVRGKDVLGRYGLTDAQQDAFMQSVTRLKEEFDRSAEQSQRDLCNYNGSKQGLEDAINETWQNSKALSTRLAEELKTAIDEATMLAMAQEALKVPTMRPQKGDGVIRLAEVETVEGFKQGYCDRFPQGGDTRKGGT